MQRESFDIQKQGFQLRSGSAGVVALLVNQLVSDGWNVSSDSPLCLLFDAPHGFALHQLLSDAAPQGIEHTIVITASACPEYLLDLADLGAGAVLSDKSLHELSNLMQRVLEGETGIIHPMVQSTLTATERRVLHCIATGKSPKEIAEQGCFGHQYIKNTVATLYSKVEVRNLAEAIMYYWSVHPAFYEGDVTENVVGR